MLLPKKLETSCQFFTRFLISAANLKFLQKKMTLIAYVFSKLQTVKDNVKQMFK